MNNLYPKGHKKVTSTLRKGINKRGLSTIVTTLIVILLTLVAIGIVWAVIKNMLDESVDNISLDQITIDLEIKSAKINGWGNLDVGVKRNIGNGRITGVAFIISDGVKEEIIKMINVNLSELEEKSFNINYSVSKINKISLAPIFTTDSGKEKIGRIVNNFEPSNKETMRSISGLVSWWKFDNVIGTSIYDEMGKNNGTMIGNVNCSVQGKFGNACGFDGKDWSNYVKINTNDGLQLTGEMTMIFWAKLNIVNGTFISKLYPNLGLGNTGGPMRPYFILGADAFPPISVKYVYINPSVIISPNNWYYMAGSYNGSSINIYINESMSKVSYSSGIFNNVSNFYEIGKHINATIDEVMIFNRALSDSEIREIYAIDLN